MISRAEGSAAVLVLWVRTRRGLGAEFFVGLIEMRLLTMDGRCNICGERIRIAREQAKLSQEALAAKVQLSGHSLTQKAISRTEMGLRTVPDYEIPLFANALGVSPLWLLGLSEVQ